MPIVEMLNIIIAEDGTQTTTQSSEWFPPAGALAPAYSQGPTGDMFDLIKGASIFRAKVREARAPLMSVADVAVNVASDNGDAAAEKAARQARQALRDLPDNPAIDLAKTVDELKALWPATLGPSPL